MIRALIAALLLAGPAAAKKKLEKPMEWKGAQNGSMTVEHQVVADQKAWEILWVRLGQDAPELDFKKNVAVVVYAGERPTGGWTVEFLDALPARDGGLKVKYRVKGPPPDAFVTQAFTQPWKVRAFPRPRGQVVVEAVAK
jgi:hypothetical protein